MASHNTTFHCSMIHNTTSHCSTSHCSSYHTTPRLIVSLLTFFSSSAPSDDCQRSTTCCLPNKQFQLSSISQVQQPNSFIRSYIIFIENIILQASMCNESILFIKSIYKSAFETSWDSDKDLQSYWRSSRWQTKVTVWNGSFRLCQRLLDGFGMTS